MARMIPPYLPATNVPPGEADLFRRLRDDPVTVEWTVLHSLDVARHQTQIAGEIDFVVLVPHKGVLCLEVKSHNRIRRTNGTWYYGADSKGEVRGPFKQAADAMHSVRRRIVEGHSNLSRIVFWSGVVFPFAPFRIESTEWHNWQVIDTTKYRSKSIGHAISSMLDAARYFLANQFGAAWFDLSSQEPTREQCEEIAALLRPDFEFYENPAARSRRTAAEIYRFTSEQFTALDAMQRNSRVVFSGPAGTGKTVLAIEAARRSAVEGKHVLLICFNKLLGDRLAKETATIDSSIHAITLHSHMIHVAGRPDIQEGSLFWMETLPELAIDAMLGADGHEYIFDELVVDEAQDILHAPYLDFLDLSLRGGLSAGRWRMFGDFERQAIYASSAMSLQDFIEARANGTPIYDLRTNCRNTPRVAEFVHLLGRLVPRYQRILRPDNNLEPKLVFYDSPAMQRAHVITAIREFLDGGASLDEIVILSPRSTGSFAYQLSLEPEWSGRVLPYAEHARNAVRFSTIHSFKGMEAPYVIVTDIDSISTQSAQALFYIAATRALEQLTFVMESRMRAELRAQLAVGG